MSTPWIDEIVSDYEALRGRVPARDVGLVFLAAELRNLVNAVRSSEEDVTGDTVVGLLNLIHGKLENENGGAILVDIVNAIGGLES